MSWQPRDTASLHLLLPVVVASVCSLVAPSSQLPGSSSRSQADLLLKAKSLLLLVCWCCSAGSAWFDWCLVLAFLSLSILLMAAWLLRSGCDASVPRYLQLRYSCTGTGTGTSVPS
jgi:hypothetical protein